MATSKEKQVTGTVVEIGDIPVDGHIYKVAALVQFDSADDLKAAITSTATLRLEWPLCKIDR